MILSHPVPICHLGDRGITHPEVKDPSIYVLPNGNYEICVSKGHSGALTAGGPMEQWQIGRFEGKDLHGPWTEKAPLELNGLADVRGCTIVPAEVCAPAVVCSADASGGIRYDLYVQSCCFQAGGAILHAGSQDGTHYHFDATPLVTANDIPQTVAPLKGLYDASISDIIENGKPYEVLTFSGYRTVGCGDIFGMRRPKTSYHTQPWQEPKCIIRQEEMKELEGAPFHNQPGCDGYEWGLEGAKILQLAKDRFLVIGVSFLPPENGAKGTRQRVFMAASNRPDGPFVPMCHPLEPHGVGENGHPDTIDMGDRIAIIYQERLKQGDADGPWHPCYAEMDKKMLLDRVSATLEKSAAHATGSLMHQPAGMSR